MGKQTSKIVDGSSPVVSSELKPEKVKALFHTLDENKSKKLDFNEFCALWTVCEMKPNKHKTKVQVFERFDVNKDGAIDMAEFQDFVDGINYEKGVNQIPEVYEWEYGSHNGPDTWCAHFEAANGLAQSPIDVQVKNAQKENDRPPVTVHYKNCKAVCLNNSHTVCWSVEDAGHIMIGQKKYKLAQFHYHCPSEHYLNGEQYPLCLHFVHVAEDGELAVLGYVFQTGTKSNSFLDCVCEMKPLKAHENCDVASVPFELLNVEGDYIHYSGSLTTPPCSEGVVWHVQTEVQPFTHAQENWFRSCICHDNARPMQKMNDRVMCCVPVTKGGNVAREV